MRVDHFQSGSYTARPIVTPPSVIFSNRAFSKEITSSGVSNRFRITCGIEISSEGFRPARRAAIDLEIRTVDVPGLIRGKESHDISDLVRLRIPTMMCLLQS